MTDSWLIDKSAYERLGTNTDQFDRWLERIQRGLVHVSTTTILQMGYSARNAVDWVRSIREPPVSMLIVEYVTPAIEDRAVEVQHLLAERGQHRAPGIPDLLIAATAEMAGHTVLHHDKDFELIAGVTGQPVEQLEL